MNKLAAFFLSAMALGSIGAPTFAAEPCASFVSEYSCEQLRKIKGELGCDPKTLICPGVALFTEDEFVKLLDEDASGFGFELRRLTCDQWWRYKARIHAELRAARNGSTPVGPVPPTREEIAAAEAEALAELAEDQRLGLPKGCKKPFKANPAPKPKPAKPRKPEPPLVPKPWWPDPVGVVAAIFPLGSVCSPNPAPVSCEHLTRLKADLVCDPKRMDCSNEPLDEDEFWTNLHTNVNLIYNKLGRMTCDQWPRFIPPLLARARIAAADGRHFLGNRWPTDEELAEMERLSKDPNSLPELRDQLFGKCP